MEKLVVANWKQNKNLSEIETWFRDFSSLYKPPDGVEVVLCPSHPYLWAVKDAINLYSLKNVSVGAQDASAFLSGPHTGEVSASQVRDFCKFCIVGHSERGEELEIVDVKLSNCLSEGITPILCIRDVASFRDIYPKEVILVWEDPKNISEDGEYRNKNKDEIESGISAIRNKVGFLRPVLYGGSVNENDALEMAGVEGVSGFLVGHASLNPSLFVKTIEALL